MKIHIRLASKLGLAAMAVLAMPALAMAQDAGRPNILLIVADDLGYSDIGAFGGEIRTPNLDELAAEGLVFNNFYASPFCSPTRAMLMTGTDNHRVGFGAMVEAGEPELRNRPGYEGYLNERAVAFPQLLQDAGYRTYMTGKWHLGVAEEASPAARGFDRSYALVQGSASHFDQTAGFSPDPDKRPKAVYREDGKTVDLPEDFYSSTFFVDQMIHYLAQDQGSSDPFFAYLAFTAPHWPLQAPDEDIARYEGSYDVGYDEIRARRLDAMQARGIFRPDVTVYSGHEVWPAWDELTDRQKRTEAKRMAVYAAMVDRMDQEIGRLIAYLDTTGRLDNTLIWFLSDNGADGNSIADLGRGREWIERQFDNSIENTGRANSYVDYGPGWAQIGATPFHLYKAFAYEGGIRVPAFAVLPKAMRTRGGQMSAAFAQAMDIAPTVLDFAGIAQPGDSYRRQPVTPMTGKSLRPLLQGDAERVHGPEEAIGWELHGRKALRKGDWKIVYANTPWGTDAWELYNVSTDPAELADLAETEPAKLAELVADYQAWASNNGVVDLTQLGVELGYSNGLGYYDDIR